MGIPICVVDAFTARRFRGNPAAVCFLNDGPEPEWMQALAREMNLSETAFLRPREDGFALRWFTPTVEVDLCGHATLAAAHALWESGRLPLEQPARFHTRSGWLICGRREEWIEMDFPATPAAPALPPPGLLAGLGLADATAGYVGQTRFDYLVRVESAALVRALRPDHARLRTLPVRGVMVTAPSDEPAFDFTSRFFAPGSGIDEDPVTGSAHCALAPYWARELGKAELTGYQASERGGVVRVRLQGERVALGGQAVTVWRGELA